MTFDLSEKLIIDIGRIALRYNISKVILFGSRARGNNKPMSDIDLAVFPQADFEKWGSFSSEIDDLETLLKIDTVIINENTDPKLLANINQEGVIIYEQS